MNKSHMISIDKNVVVFLYEYLHAKSHALWHEKAIFNNHMNRRVDESF